MLEHARAASGERLKRPDYHARFWDLAASGIDLLWKVERQQHFSEPYNESWAAFDRGDWDEALRLTGDQAPDIAKKLQEGAFRSQRLRIVELPLSPYLLWEFQVLKIRYEAGEDIRILGPEAIAHLESEEPLPEVVGLGNTVMFEVIYDSAGTPDGARQINDSELIVACRREFETLFPHGEPLSTFFDREVAGKRPPAPEVPAMDDRGTG